MKYDKRKKIDGEDEKIEKILGKETRWHIWHTENLPDYYYTRTGHSSYKEQCFDAINKKISEGLEVTPEEKMLYAKLKEDREQLTHKYEKRKKFYDKHHKACYRFSSITDLDIVDMFLAGVSAVVPGFVMTITTKTKEIQLIEENMENILPLQQDYINQVVVDASSNYGANFIPNVNTIVDQIKNFAGPEGYRYHSHAYDFWTKYAMDVEMNLKQIARDYVAVDFTTPLQLGLGIFAGVIGAWAICYGGRKLYRKLSAISLEKKGDKVGEEIKHLLSEIDEKTKELKGCMENSKHQAIVLPEKCETEEEHLETIICEEDFADNNPTIEMDLKVLEEIKLEQEKLKANLSKLEQEKAEIEKKLNGLKDAEDAYSKKIETPKNEQEMGLWK